MRNRISKAALGVIALVLVAGVAGADAPDGDVLHGCIKNRSGLLRIVENGQACRGSERPLAWNQSGPIGPQGPAAPAPSFVVISGTLDPHAESSTFLHTVACPDEMVALAGSGWVTMDPDWFRLTFSIPVRLVQGGAVVDWTSWEWDLDPDTKVSWDVTCATKEATP